MTEQLYSSVEVCARLDITYRQLDYWCRIGIIDDNADGSGSQRSFTAAQLAEVRVVAEAAAFLRENRRRHTIAYLKEVGEILRKAELYDDLLAAHAEALKINRQMADALRTRPEEITGPVAQEFGLPQAAQFRQSLDEGHKVSVAWKGPGGYYWAHADEINHEIAQELDRTMREQAKLPRSGVIDVEEAPEALNKENPS